mmetsp:Transcript_6876/g.12304  ORF Transcript_6876/g.12304 Transcript_6876/m.12304 type:complete len:374 (-) Transcript_6876:1640-2761(-)
MSNPFLDDAHKLFAELDSRIFAYFKPRVTQFLSHDISQQCHLYTTFLGTPPHSNNTHLPRVPHSNSTSQLPNNAINNISSVEKIKREAQKVLDEYTSIPCCCSMLSLISNGSSLHHSQQHHSQCSAINKIPNEFRLKDTQNSPDSMMKYIDSLPASSFINHKQILTSNNIETPPKPSTAPESSLDSNKQIVSSDPNTKKRTLVDLWSAETHVSTIPPKTLLKQPRLATQFRPQQQQYSMMNAVPQQQKMMSSVKRNRVDVEEYLKQSGIKTFLNILGKQSGGGLNVSLARKVVKKVVDCEEFKEGGGEDVYRMLSESWLPEVVDRYGDKSEGELVKEVLRKGILIAKVRAAICEVRNESNSEILDRIWKTTCE